MHETALMQNMIRIASKALEGKNIKCVNRVTLSVGKMSNALPDALNFAFEAMTQEGLLKGATLEIEEIPVAVRCERCGKNYEPEKFPFVCPQCQCCYYTITQGEDIYIQSLDCEEN
jgi:hydrogenase nickel incorporation protein HypA/HybF